MTKKVKYLIILLLYPNSWLWMLTAVLALISELKGKIRLKVYVSEFLFVSVLIASLVAGFVYYINKNQPVLYLATFVAICLGYLGATLFSNMSISKRIGILDFLVNVNAIVLITQHLIFFITREYVDVHSVASFGNFISRYESNFFGNFGLIRPTSFFVEPSNASAFILFCVALRIIYSLDEVTFFRVLWLCTVPALTLSIAGFAASSVLLLAFSARKINLGKNFLRSISLTLFVTILGFIFIEFIDFRRGSGLDYDPFAYRGNIFAIGAHVIKSNILTGVGVYFSEANHQLPGAILRHSYVRDSGVIPNIFISCGLVGVITFAYHLFQSSGKKIFASLIMVAPFMMKLDYLYLSFWFYFFSIRRTRWHV